MKEVAATMSRSTATEPAKRHATRDSSMRDKRSSSSLSTSPCAPLRDAYHNCFNRWYAEKFLKGQWDKEECVSEWQKYRACLSENLEDKHLSRFLEAEGIVHENQDDMRKGAASG